MSWLENLFLSEEKKTKIDEIKVYIQNEKYDLALNLLDNLIGARTPFIDLYLLQVFCYIKINNYEMAQKVLDKVFAIDINNKEAIYYLGLIYKEIKNYQKAYEYFRKAINLGYDKFDIYNDLADLYLFDKDYEKAYTQLKISLGKENNNLDTYKKIIEILILKNDITMANSFCFKALEIKYDPFFIKLMVENYIKLKKEDDLIKYLENYLKNANYIEIYSNLINIYLLKENYSLALEKLDEALKLYPHNITIKNYQMEFFYYQKEYDKLIEVSKSIFIEDLDYKSFYLIGIYFYYKAKSLYLEKNDNFNTYLKLAKLYLEESYKIEKNYFNIYYLALLHELKKSEVTIIIALLIESSEFCNNNNKIDIYQKIASLYLDSSNFDKALLFSKKALNLATKENNLFFKRNEITKFISNINAKNENKLINNNDIFIKNNDNLGLKLKNIKFYLKKYQKFQNIEDKLDELIYELNQPVNIAIMGEFKAGKSTFINALLGKELAPMGVTPTTATLNFFKYGKENKIKILYKNNIENAIKEIPIEEITNFTDERVLDKKTIENVDFLEIYYNWDKLRDINIIDTPGLNAGIERHEEITQNFIKKADLVIWIFDIEQTGKFSEKQAFDKIKAFNKNIIAIINGSDKVEDKEEINEVVEYLKEALGEYFINILAVSSKKALYGKITNNYNEKDFITLETYLEKNIYAEILSIKSKSIENNLIFLIKELNNLINNEDRLHLDILDKFYLLQEKISLLDKELIKNEFDFKNNLKAELELFYLKLAQEIKVFIRPKQGVLENVFGKNKFEQEELNFTIRKIYNENKELLFDYSENLKNISKNTSQKLLYSISEDLVKHNFEHTFFDILNTLKIDNIEANIINPNINYLLGYIEGGSIEKLFNELSIENDLSERNIYQKLIKYLPNITESLENSFITWKNNYIKALENFINKAKNNFDDSYFSLKTEIIEPLKLIL
ncbi:MAG: dynamin family protein [Candidatus Sericytochromatia bacterium]